MGYTNYWSHTRTHSPRKIAAAIRPLIEHGIARGILAGGDGTGNPNLDRGIFNGQKDLGLAHETFNPDPQAQLGFCKTARKPYDSYVKAALYRLKGMYPNSLHIDSDGGNRDSEWDIGAWEGCPNPRDLYREVFGEDPLPANSVLDPNF